MADNTRKENSNKYYQIKKLVSEEYDHQEHKPESQNKRCFVVVILICSFMFIALVAASSLISLYLGWAGRLNLPANIFWKNHLLNLGSITTKEAPSKVISCYYNFPSDHETNQLMLLDIHPNLCTHINLAFAQVVNKEIKLENYQYKVLLDAAKLKLKNPNLKILLSIGGGKNDDGFPDMVSNHESRKKFIKSIKYLLRNYTLDGIDLDWEFPALHDMQVGGRERQHFSQLLREIRMEYNREKRDYILTIAAAAPQTIVDIAYDVDQLNQYLDFVNIMTYDFHFYTKYTPFTGFNSPLYPRETEQLYLATLNINYTVNMYINKGLDPNKIVVGIPTYGHTFTLVNANNHQVSSPASGFGSLGSLGFINYPEVCTFVTNTTDVTVMEDNEAKVPYLYRNKEWVSYEGPWSVMEKAKFIIENQLRGAMIYSLNADDYRGVCGGGLAPTSSFPLSVAVSETLRNFLN